MSNIYNYGLAGVGAQVQFGKGGNQLLSNTGTFSAIAADGTTLVRFEIADPVGNHDAVTLETLTTFIGNVTTKINLVQSNVTANVAALTTLINNNYAAEQADIQNTNANLAANVSTLTTAINLVNSNVVANIAQVYVDLGSNVTALTTLINNNESNTVANATQLANAIATSGTTLQSQINLVQSNVTSNVAQIYVDLGSNAASILANLATVNANVISNVANIETNLTTIENAVGLNTTTGAFINFSGTTFVDCSVTIANAIYLLDAAANTSANLSGATFAAIYNTINTVQSNVTSNVSTLTSAINTVQSNVTSNVAQIYVDLGSNVSTLNSTINTVQSNVTANVAQLYVDLGTNAASILSNLSTVNSNVIQNFNTEQADIANTNANLASNVITLTNLIDEVASNATNTTAAIYTALGSTNSNVASEIARAEAAELVLTDAVTAIQESYVNKDGSVPFVGNVSMGGFVIQNVANPVTANDAVNLQTLTVAIAALGSGFNYVGVLSNAAASANVATDISSLKGPVGANLAAGDYWKTTTTGWYSYNSVAFFVEANDGIVFNTTDGFDTIAHVDSQVFGNPGQIDVTGSVDTGFTVSIDSIFVGYVTTLQGNVIQLANSITAEMQRAEAAEANIAANVAGEISRAISTEDLLNSNIVAEVNRAVAAESTLNSNIIQNYSTFVANASTLNNAISAEVTRASTAEANIAANVATIEASVGLDSNGNYVTPVGTTFLGNTSNVMAALYALDIAANTGANGLSNAVSTLNNTINTVQSNVTSNVAQIYTDLQSNASSILANVASTNANLAANVITLTNAINLVQSNVTANVAQLYTDLQSNASSILANVAIVNANVVANVANIETNLTTIENAVGLSLVDGSFINFSGTTFIDCSVTIANAIYLLDAAANTGANGLANAVSTLNNTINTVQSNVTSNVVTLTNAINLVQSNVTANIAQVYADLGSNVTTLSNLINANESNTVGNAISLATAIAAIENSVGLNPDGTYLAPTGTNFVDGSTSVANAIVLLDNAIEFVVNTVDHLTQYQIITATGNTIVRVEDSNGVTTYLDVAGAPQLVANVVGSAATNTLLTTDFTVANAITLSAGGAATNVSIYLEPKGDGNVVIGQPGVPGFIQAEAGQTLEIAGGDNTSGNGGSLILRGGLGTSTNGNVTIEDASGNFVATFAGVTGTNSNLSFINGANSVTIAAAGNAVNSSIILTPMGTGAVSVSGANVQNVANAIANTDAVNLGQLNSAVIAAQTGVVYTTSVTVAGTTGVYNIGTAISGTIIRARVYVGSAMDSATTIDVGTTSGGFDLLANTSIDQTLTAQFFVGDISMGVTAQQLYASVNASVTGGNATIMVEYIHA